MVSLFCTSAFAEGEMGGGGLAESAEGSKTVIIRTAEEGEMGGGGKLTDTNYFGSVFTSIYDYFDRMF
jgi:hypothetical protein